MGDVCLYSPSFALSIALPTSLPKAWREEAAAWGVLRAVAVEIHDGKHSLSGPVQAGIFGSC